MIEKVKWKTPLFDENNNVQKTRVFRPKEALAVIDNIDVKDELTWNFLQNKEIETEDVKAWLTFLLFTGCRFSEMTIVKKDPKLYRENGTIRIPNYVGKELRTIKARNILLSDRGREQMESFYAAQTPPPDDDKKSDPKEYKQTISSITSIMHRAGKRIGLQEETFDIRVKHRKKDADNRPLKIKRMTRDGREIEVYDVEVEIKQIITNGCSIRSMRKTWESWLIHTFGGEKLETQVFLSQGHKKATAIQYYLNTGFDEEDLQEIAECVKGYGVLNTR